ncbi:sulfite exporter TauE/SafE family protein [Candidatus Pseudothioglobus singularis]|nr:sulfite exporter TauE/SafE family protein [Candidatus Pseudothioglobus singularis]MDB4822935.1 sulfite exporter TauE/SafE family protein [Candidatus Pseudothioglobus singularis]MDC0620759.1 sulfite exporter TauE/SafE family protein [Candidatus Pseudothioglobus singularis]
MSVSDPSLYLLILLSGAFLGAFVQGATGFGSGLLINAFWLHIMEPTHAIPLNVVTSLFISGVPIYKLRKKLDFSKLKQFAIFGVVGIPIGMYLLVISDPSKLKFSIGILLVIYALLMLKISSFSINVNNKSINNIVGFISGVIGGLTALLGIIPVAWFSVQRLPKNTKRGTYEPFIFITSIAAIISFAFVGLYKIEMIFDLLKIIPALLVGSWLGIKIYNKINDNLFRKVVLGLILLSGLFLVI